MEQDRDRPPRRKELVHIVRRVGATRAIVSTCLRPIQNSRMRARRKKATVAAQKMASGALAWSIR